MLFHCPLQFELLFDELIVRWRIKWLMILHYSNKNLFSIAASLRHIKVFSFGSIVEWSFMQVKACHNGKPKKNVWLCSISWLALLVQVRSFFKFKIWFPTFEIVIHVGRIIHGVYRLLVCSYWAVSHWPVLLDVVLIIQNLIVSHCLDVLLILAKYCM